MRTVRLSNIELLRIIAMFAIVLFHSIYHGNYGITSFENRNEIYIKFVQAFGEIGVNIFMLISGYFLIMIHKEISVKRIINIWIPCVFYSIIITLVYSIFGVSDFVWGGGKRDYPDIPADCI